VELFRKNKYRVPNVFTHNETEKLPAMDKATLPGCVWLMDAIEVDNDSLHHFLWKTTMPQHNTVLLAPDTATGTVYFLMYKFLLMNADLFCYSTESSV